jgi:hypothetical protein
MDASTPRAKFVEYNDEEICHVEAGPDYGNADVGRWGEQDSFESFYKDRYTFNGFFFRLVLE